MSSNLDPSSESHLDLRIRFQASEEPRFGMFANLQPGVTSARRAFWTSVEQSGFRGWLQRDDLVSEEPGESSWAEAEEAIKSQFAHALLDRLRHDDDHASSDLAEVIASLEVAAPTRIIGYRSLTVGVLLAGTVSAIQFVIKHKEFFLALVAAYSPQAFADTTPYPAHATVAGTVSVRPVAEVEPSPPQTRVPQTPPADQPRWAWIGSSLLVPLVLALAVLVVAAVWTNERVVRTETMVSELVTKYQELINVFQGQFGSDPRATLLLSEYQELVSSQHELIESLMQDRANSVP